MVIFILIYSLLNFLISEGEAFKIKKSKESRRMTKEKKKERRNPSETKKPKDNSGNEDDVILFNEEVKCKFKRTIKI